MIYLDNAATSYPKPEKVYEEMDKCMRRYCANPGRSGHKMALASGKAILAAREKVSRFFNIDDPMRLCFTKNATEALNIGIKGILKPGDHVITTSMEHNSVVRPLKTLEKTHGIEITFLEGDDYGMVDPEDVQKNIKSNTRLITVTVSSNVNGVIMPVAEIGKVARENSIPFLVDGSQGAGSMEIDVKKMNIDMLAFPGHKGLLGPQGTGGLYVSENLEITPLTQGGTGSNSENVYQPDFMPDQMESGTLNTPGIVGLSCGIDFINSFSLRNLVLYKKMLIKRLFDGLETIKGVKIYSPKEIELNSGIVAIRIGDMDSALVAYKLDKNYEIAVRPGLHCASLAHKKLGTTDIGLVRISHGCFNTIDDIDELLKAVEIISHEQEN